jgi:protein-disulfide isomerase
LASRQRQSGIWSLGRRGPVFALLGLVAIGAVIGIGVAAQPGASPSGAGPSGLSVPANGAPPVTAKDMARRIPGDPTALGDPQAPVVLVEYSDLRCPFCGIYARDTLPVLVNEYVTTGKIRVEWRDFPVFGQESIDAAVADRAAGEQGKFWQFNAATYAHAPERAHLELTKASLLQLARGVGVPDMARFESDLTSPVLLARVNADAKEAYSIGATGTPQFLVNGTTISGAQPVDVFRQVIDNALVQAAKK